MHNWFIPIALSLALDVGAAPPQRVEITYEIMRNGAAVGEVTGRLEHDGRHYRLEESWRGKGVLATLGEARRMSRGAIAADGLHPSEFEDRRPGREPKRITFDAAKTGPGSPQQDRLSSIWNFAFVPPRAETTVVIANGKGVSTQVYLASGRERVRVSAGEFDALKLVRKKAQSDDRSTEIWLATDRSYLPLRILVTEKDGTRLDQVAVRIAVQ